MKLPYLDAIKPHVEPSIYNRGLRLYLNGGVSSPRSLLLDNWREYEVSEKNHTVTVRIPVLHLALDSSKFPRAYQALEQVVSCECEYFLHDGMCQHIAGVIAAMDKEFNTTTSFTKQSVDSGDLLDNIFTAQKIKIHRKWLATMDTLLTRETANYYYLDEISKTVKEEPGEHEEFFTQLAKLIEPHIGYYSKEKRIVKIALESILIGKVRMWNFYLPYIERMDEANQLQFWVSMWKFYWMGASEGYKIDLLGRLRDLGSDFKEAVLRKLMKEYSAQNEVYLEFCFLAQHYSYLVKHKETLSEKDLIRLTEILPDLRESTDVVLAGHLRTWSDFLQTGEYKEFLELITLWADKLGKSEVFVDTLKYIITNHQKKKSLVSKLRDMI